MAWHTCTQINVLTNTLKFKNLALKIKMKSNLKFGTFANATMVWVQAQTHTQFWKLELKENNCPSSYHDFNRIAFFEAEQCVMIASNDFQDYRFIVQVYEIYINLAGFETFFVKRPHPLTNQLIQF